MKEPTYRNALAHAWQITKTQKMLWFFGFFAAWLGQMGLMDMVAHMIVTQKEFAWYPTVFSIKTQIPAILQSFEAVDFSFADKLWFGWLGLFLLGVGIALICVSIASQGALIHGISQSFSRVKKHIDVSTAWHSGVSHLGRLFFVQLLKKGIIFVITFFLGLALVNVIDTGKQAQELVVFFALFILGTFVGVVVSLLSVYAAGYIVIEKYGFVQAIHEAWNLFKAHWLVSLEIGVMLLFVNLLAAMLIFCIGLFFLVEMGILWAAAISIQSTFLWMISVFFGIGLLIVSIAAVGTAMNVFTTSVWTYLFVRMHKKGMVSRILHLLVK